jgi:multiple sugar transport system ATP-binding protein
MREEIARIQKTTKVTTIFVTHDQNEAMHISDKIMLLSDGHIQQFDKPNNLYDKPANLFTAQFIGEPQINIIKNEKSLANFNTIFSEKISSVGIRPDSISLLKTKDTFSLPAKVSSYNKYGAEETTNFELFDEDIIGINVDGITENNVNQKVTLYVPISEIHGFNENDESVRATSNKKSSIKKEASK